MTRRHSKKREQILSLLQQEICALSAAQLHERLPEIDLATIYRNLELFVEDGVVKKLQLGGKEAQYELKSASHHHAVCGECKKVMHFNAPDKKIKELLGLDGFEIGELEVTVRGTCCKKQ
ncbi:MAG: transcriptional repressor [Patescibacteria group bacterium]